MMKYVMMTALAAAAVSALPAQAQRYDAFESFDGTQGGPNLANKFIYGEANAANPSTPGTNFTANTNCFISNATCLQLAPNGDVPGVTKGGSPAFQYGTVLVPQDRLLAHPDDDSDLTYIAFVAPTAGVYRLFATFNVQDINPSGVDLFQIGTTGGGLPLTFQQVGSLSAGSPTVSFARRVTLGASEAVGYGIGNGGSYSNDSTGVNFTVLAGVPEPTSWAMMIGGFGVVGGSLRRRARSAKLATA